MAYYDEEDKRYLTATEIVDRFGVDYYKLQIEDYQERISNILAGHGDYADGITYVSAEKLKTSKDRDIRISELRKNIEHCEETIQEINNAITLVRQSMATLRNAAETHALVSAISDDLRYCFLKYTDKDKDGNQQRIPSDTYDAIFVNKVFKKVKSKYRRLWSKEQKKADAVTRKIKKDIYQKLKKLNGLNIVDMSDNKRYYESKDKYDYYSLVRSMKENNHTLKGFADDLSSDLRREYPYYDRESLAPLGVDIDKINIAKGISDGKNDDFLDEFGPILKSMEYLASEYSIQNRFKTFYVLKENVREAEKLSREVRCLDLIIEAYRHTSIASSDLYKELLEVYYKQNKKLAKLANKVREMYEKSGMKEYIELEQKLRDLHKKAGSLRYQVSISEERLGYSNPETRKLNDMYFGARAEMLNILLKYPELNRPEYGIDLTKYDKKGNYIEEEPEKEATPEPTYREPVKVEKEEPIIPIRVVTAEELKHDLGMDDAEGKKPWEAVEDTKEVATEEDTIVVPEHLTGIRTAYYSRYMVEKVKGSELGKMKFSEYLENVALDQKELIEIEQKREKRAANVFKLYIQYLAASEDKSKAMRFSDFARLRHGLKQEELPFEYSDDEVQKRLKK